VTALLTALLAVALDFAELAGVTSLSDALDAVHGGGLLERAYEFPLK